MSAKIIVGFARRPLDNDQLKQLLKACGSSDNQNISDQDCAAMLQQSPDNPYLHTFDQVFLVNMQHEEVTSWSYRAPDSNKSPICMTARHWLLHRYKEDELRNGEVQFVGFAPQVFLAQLVHECSLPTSHQPLPYDLLRQPQVVDLDMLVTIPARPLSLRAALLHRGLKLKDDWQRPGVNPEEDVRLATELSWQLGVL